MTARSVPAYPLRLLRLVLLVSALPAIVALAGAWVGSELGRRVTFLAATVFGTFGVLGAVAWLVRLGWLDDGRRRGAAIGGLVGLGLGAPIAAMSLDHPLAVVGGALCIGIGVLVGIGGGGIR